MSSTLKPEERKWDDWVKTCGIGVEMHVQSSLTRIDDD